MTFSPAGVLTLITNLTDLHQPPYALKTLLALYQQVVFSDTASTVITKWRSTLHFVFINGIKTPIKL